MGNQGFSRNVEDVRQVGYGSYGLRPGGIGLGSLVIALILGWIFGINPLQILGLLSGGGDGVRVVEQQGPAPAADDAKAQFVSQILRSTEDVWGQVFAEKGRTYQEPRLRLFRGRYPTACGMGEAAAGPFYCPDDQIIYLDLRFFDLLSRKLGSPGQFAHAYVVAHEVGHHVQNQLGILARQDRARAMGVDQGAGGMSVRIELQADCFAGVWTNRSQHQQGWRLEPGDIETALNAAAQIADDTLQSRSTGVVVPDTFTHGTSAQRVSWFQRGFHGGEVASCDTFATRVL
jgi:predicted metalloprotease